MNVTTAKEHLYISEVCRNSNLFLLVVITQAFACVFTVLIFQEQFFSKLGLVTLYCQWIVLSFSALVCLCRPYLVSVSQVTGYFCLWGLFVVCFLLTEIIAQLLIDIDYVGFDWLRFFRMCIVALILSVLMLWCFILIGRMNKRAVAESEAKVQALQARIKPHFFFNTLNTISELMVVKPSQAESAIESLGILFRAALESDNAFHTLNSELNLCDRYISLEKWRWQGDRNINISVNVSDSNAWLVPKLILQPLLENAIKYGATSEDSSEILIDIRETDSALSFKVQNIVAPQDNNKEEGFGMALDNIKERLFVLYDDQHSFNLKSRNDSFVVFMKIPKRHFSKKI